MIELARLLPVPGPVWGDYPMRDDDSRALSWRRPRAVPGSAGLRRIAARAAACAADCRALDADERAARLSTVRQQLRRQGLNSQALAQALGMAAHAAEESLGWTARPTQLLAAAALLDNRMAEMATGEGKTLAIALAAGVGGLAGIPVHVVTANSYLAGRDATRLQPFFGALGLTVGALEELGAPTEGRSEGPGPVDPGQRRRETYARHVVYATAKDLAFDFLRDRQAGKRQTGLARQARALAGDAPSPMLLRGLCMALLDEADSILLDEAEVPLILSQSVPQAARRAFLWQALALARVLVETRDYTVRAADRSVLLTAEGEAQLQTKAADLGGPWRQPRYRREAVQLALAALHLYRKDQHYVVAEGQIALLDELTGRVATGRVWSRGLHTLVALKEGLRPPAETETLASTTFQRFFQRYWRLGGISGTLWEARAELKAVYGLPALRVPLHQRCRRIELPARRFDDQAGLFDAVVARVAELHRAGRPVLVGTDSVSDSERLSALLRQQGLPHAVLNALRHAEEARIVAAAGRAGQITVATRMAGRGTDIELDEAAHAAGGLHVLSCQNNPSRRQDRQLCGRAGRNGDPGSTETWCFRASSPSSLSTNADKAGKSWKTSEILLDRWLSPVWLRRLAQAREERRRATLRRQLLEQDRHWERRLSFAGRSD